MNDPNDATEIEVELFDRLVELYPAAAGFGPDKDARIYEAAAESIALGVIERTAVESPEGGMMIAYRLSEEGAEAVQRIVAERADQARWN